MNTVKDALAQKSGVLIHVHSGDMVVEALRQMRDNRVRSVLSFPLEVATVRGGLDETRPKLMSFLQRIHARPAYKRALEKGGAYRYAT